VICGKLSREKRIIDNDEKQSQPFRNEKEGITMHSQSKTVHEIMIRIINKASSLMTEPRTFGIDELLYTSEIHMVDVIGRNPGINVTEIAQKLGITKGAIPKIIRKLIQKGLINRYQSKDNKRIVQFELTDKGQIAFQQHIEFHRKFDNSIIQTFDSVSEQNLRFLNEIMSEVEQHIDKIRQSH
jgi:DNA-binding MarR family transcriptional regulator